MKRTAAYAWVMSGVVVTGLVAAPAWAVPLETEIRFNHADAAPDDRLGQAVSISGNIAIAGANRNDDDGSNSGSAYLFDVNTGSQLHKLTASDAAAGDLFGHSVGVSGNTAIVSSFGNSDAGEDSGSAYLFDVTSGDELFKLTASDAAAGDYFGHGLGISGNVAIVGSHGDDVAGTNSGSAYLFDVTTGNELFKLTPADGSGGDQFGYWAAISGNVAIVGAKKDDDHGTSSGSAYLFDVTTGNELMKLTASDGRAYDEFGYAVAIDGNTAVVGAWLHDGAGGDSGAVYVFDVTTGQQLRKLTALDAGMGDLFGYSLGISGSTVLVGAYGDSHLGHHSGSAYLFDLVTGNQFFKITASDEAAGDEFGTAVGVSGNTGFVGAWLGDDANGFNVGQVYAYDFSAKLPPGADFDDDGDFDGDDLAHWERDFGGSGSDADGDGDSDGSDFLTWQEQFGSSARSPAAAGIAVPEPATLLTIVGMVGTSLLIRIPQSRSPAL